MLADQAPTTESIRVGVGREVSIGTPPGLHLTSLSIACDVDRFGVVPAEGGQAMPIIDVKVMEGVLSAEQKQKIARGITDAFADAVGEPGVNDLRGRRPAKV